MTTASRAEPPAGHPRDGAGGAGRRADRRVLVAIATTLLLWASAFVAIRVALPGFSVAGLSLDVWWWRRWPSGLLRH